MVEVFRNAPSHRNTEHIYKHEYAIVVGEDN